MRWSSRQKARTLPPAAESGVVAMEFIFFLPFFLLILVGLMEFGHLWNVRHAITNAGREAARAAVVAPPPGVVDRKTWAENTAAASAHNYLFPKDGAGSTQPLLPGVTLGVSPSAGSNIGDSVTVTITASNIVLFLNQLIPALNQVSFSSQTVMNME
jgi:Flp pilus assembly protein TadG